MKINVEKFETFFVIRINPAGSNFTTATISKLHGRENYPYLHQVFYIADHNGLYLIFPKVFSESCVYAWQPSGV